MVALELLTRFATSVPARQRDHPGDAHSEVYVGQCWATLNNTPFVRYKHFTDEGGIATPLIVHWPRGISSRGAIRTQFHHVIDIAPTLYEILELELPTQYCVGNTNSNIS